MSNAPSRAWKRRLRAPDAHGEPSSLRCSRAATACRDRVLRAALTPAFPPLRDGGALALALRRDAFDLGRRMVASSATLGHELFRDERATAWLSGSTIHSDLSPGSAAGAGFAFGLHLLGHAVGWGFPRGGAGRLAEALVAAVRERAGEVRCDAPARLGTAAAQPGGRRAPRRR